MSVFLSPNMVINNHSNNHNIYYIIYYSINFYIYYIISILFVVNLRKIIDGFGKKNKTNNIVLNEVNLRTASESFLD